jgi:hypothetical protein
MGGIASQIVRSGAPNWSLVRPKVRVSDLMKIYFFLHCLFYDVTVSILNYISCLLKIYTSFYFAGAYGVERKTSYSATDGARGSLVLSPAIKILLAFVVLQYCFRSR